MKVRALRLGLASIAVAAAITTTPARATVDDPASSACGGVVIEDPAGDQKAGPFPELTGSPSAGPAYMDITRVFFTAGKLRLGQAPPPSSASRRVTANIEVAHLSRDVASVTDGNVSSEVLFVVDFDDFGDSSLADTVVLDLFVKIESSGQVDYRVHVRRPTNLNEISSEPTSGRMILGEKGMIEVDFPARFAAVMAGEVTAPVKSLQNVRAYSRWAVTRPPPGHEEWDTSMPPVGDWISDDAPDGGGPEPRQVDLDGCLRAAENPDQRADLPPDGNVTRPGSGAGTGATSTDAPSGMAVVPPQKSVARATAKSRRCVRRAKKLKNRKARARAMRRCKRDRGRGSR